MAKFEMFGHDGKKDHKIEYGDLFQWTGPFFNELCIYSYDCLVSLENPRNTWWNNESVREKIIDSLNSGTLIKLPAGTKITLTQE